MSKRVLIIGCGQLGSRHLQAVASLPEVGEIYVVDPNPSSLALGQERLKEIPDLNGNIRFYWQSGLEGVRPQGDLCIVATQAPGRTQMVKEAAQRFFYRKFLIEKVVAQSVQDYVHLMDFCREHQVAVWVNCKIRTYGIHRYIKSKLKMDEPLFFSRVGGNFGLGNNGIHTADLFCYYSDAKIINPVGARIDGLVHPSARGGGIVDLSGCLYGTSDKGDDFVMCLACGHESPDSVTIVTPSGRFFVDHVQKLMMESYPVLQWEWKTVKIEEDWLVSHMVKAFAKDILAHGHCALPTLEECWPAHQFILSALQPHFERLLGLREHCPIT